MLELSPTASAVEPLLRAELNDLGVDVVDAPSAPASAIVVRVTLNAGALEVRIVDGTR